MNMPLLTGKGLLVDNAANNEGAGMFAGRYDGAPFFLGQPFTDEDRAAIDTAVSLVPMLSDLFGNTCEIVVHSLENPEHALVAASNANLSHRKIGEPIKELGMRTLLEKLRQNTPSFCLSENGSHLKVGVSPIVNSKGRCLGSVTIAMNLDVPLLQIARNIVAASDESNGGIFAGGEGIENIIGEVVAAAEADSNLPSRMKAKYIIRELFGRDVFNYRFAVQMVSEMTGISVQTVYWHLRELRKNVRK